MNKKVVGILIGVSLIAAGAAGLWWLQSSDDVPSAGGQNVAVPESDQGSTDDADEVRSGGAGDSQDEATGFDGDVSGSSTSAGTSASAETSGDGAPEGSQARGKRKDPRSELCPPKAGYGDKPKKGCKPSS